MTVATKIKDFLHNKGITQVWLAQKSGIPIVKLNLVLNGKRKLGMDEYAAIITALDVSADTFIN